MAGQCSMDKSIVPPKTFYLKRVQNVISSEPKASREIYFFVDFSTSLH
jgi:hypothetical protein